MNCLVREVQGRSNNSLISSRVSHKTGIKNHSSALVEGMSKSEVAGIFSPSDTQVLWHYMGNSSTKASTKQFLGTPLELVCVS